MTEIGPVFTAAKSWTLVRGKIVSLEALPGALGGHTRSLPRDIETSAPNRRVAPNGSREHPVGITSSGVSFFPATEPEMPATLEPVSPV